MKKSIILAGVALVMSTACTTESVDEMAGLGNRTVVRVGTEETRIYLGDKQDGAYKLYWSNGDMVNINGVCSNALSGIEPETASAEFVFDGLLTEPYDVVYPASAYSAGKVKLPMVQTYVENSFDPSAAVMAARGSAAGVALKNACGFVKINLTRGEDDVDDIRYVKFYGNADEPVCGELEVDFENAALTLPGQADFEDFAAVTLNAPDGVTLSETDPVSFIIAVPAQTFSSGFTVEVVDVLNHRMTLKSEKEQVVEAGRIISMPAREFAPTETVTDIVITTADEMVELARTVADGDLCNGKTYTLGGDIDFSGVSDWQGIGTKDLTGCFAGTFDGKGFSIKNLKSAYPIFNYTAQGAVIKNVTIDSSCRFESDELLYLAALVGMNRADVTNCVNKAEVVLSGEGLASCGAGLVARAYRQGVISKCDNYGAVGVGASSTVAKMQIVAGGVVATFERNGEGDLAQVAECRNYGTVANTSGTARLCTGGVVGRTTNVSCVVDKCDNYGSVTAEYPKADIDGTTIINQLNYIGGVVGQSTGSTVDCTNYGEVSSNVMAVESRVGGVVGTIFSGAGSVSGCVNAPEARVSSFGEIGVGDVSVVNNVYLGGVVGQSEASVTDCVNHGTVDGRSDAKYFHMGGVVGMGKNTATYTGNRNDADGRVNVNSIANEIFAGGVYGRFLAAQTITDAGTFNKGTVTMAKVEGGKAVYAYCGGIIGRGAKGSTVSNMINDGAIDIYVYPGARFVATAGIVAVDDSGVDNSVNRGTLTVHSDLSSTNSKSQIMTGGIVGWSSTNLPIVKCANEATISVVGSGECTTLRAHTGGIVGYANTELNVEDCRNLKNITRTTVDEKVNGIHSATGGIVGSIAAHKASVVNCSNEGDVVHDQVNNSYDAANALAATQSGGIVGLALGVDADNMVVIKGCTNSGTVSSKRCHAGGIAGYAKFARIEGCGFTGKVQGGGPTHSGGIAGILTSAEVRDCVVESACIYGHSGTKYDNVNYRLSGGVTAYADDVEISGCKIFAAMSRHQDYPDEKGTASVVGVSVRNDATGVTVDNCGVGGTHWLGAGNGSLSTLLATLDAENYASYICADDNASVTNCYYWNGEN